MKRDPDMMGLLLMAAALGVGRPRTRRTLLEPFQTAEPCDPSSADLDTLQRAEERRHRRAAKKIENHRRTVEGKRR